MSLSDNSGGNSTRPIKAQNPTPIAAGTPSSPNAFNWLWVGGAFFLVALIMLGLGFLLGSSNNGRDDIDRVERETVVVQALNDDPLRLTEIARTNNLATENSRLRDELLSSQQRAATLDESARSNGERWDASAATIRVLETQASQPPADAPESIVATVSSLQGTNTALQATVDAVDGSAPSPDDTAPTPTRTPPPVVLLAPGEFESAPQPDAAYAYVVNIDDGFVVSESVEACGRVQGRIVSVSDETQAFQVRWRHSLSNRAGNIATVSNADGPGAFSIDVPPEELDGVFTILLEDLTGQAVAAPLNVRFPSDCGQYELRLTFVPRAAG